MSAIFFIMGGIFLRVVQRPGSAYRYCCPVTAIHDVLWPGIREIVGDDVILSGITVNKGGYHSTRNWLKANKPGDYSIQEPLDQLGPGDQGAAIDTTFKSAQGGDFRNIARFSQRLLVAGLHREERTYPLREFQGNADLDREVEGWSYFRHHALTSDDKSHLWHIHQSIWRKYINDEAAMRSILSIWRGEPMALVPEDIDKIATAVTEKILGQDGIIENGWRKDKATNSHVALKTNERRTAESLSRIEETLKIAAQ